MPEQIDLRRALKKLDELGNLPASRIDDPDCFVFEKAFFVGHVLPVIVREGAECVAYCPDALISAATLTQRIFNVQGIGENVRLMSYFARLRCLAALAAFAKGDHALAKHFAGLEHPSALDTRRNETLPIQSPADLERGVSVILAPSAEQTGSSEWERSVRDALRSYRRFYEQTGRATAIFLCQLEQRAFPVTVIVRSIPSEFAGNLWYCTSEESKIASHAQEISSKVAETIRNYLRKKYCDTADFSDRDWVWELTDGNGTAVEYFDGRSVELALFCAVLSLIERMPIPREFIFTGEIDDVTRGILGAVSHVKEKFQAARECGARLFFYPSGSVIGDLDSFWRDSIELRASRSCFEVWSVIRRLVRSRIGLLSATRIALKYSDYVEEKNLEVSRLSRYKAAVMSSIGYAALFVLESLSIRTGSGSSAGNALVTLTTCLGGSTAGLGLFLSSLVADVTLLLGKRNNLVIAYVVLLLSVLAASIAIGVPYWGLPSSTWEGGSSQLFPNIPAHFATLKNAFFFFLWACLFYLPQMHFCAAVEDLASREGLRGARPYFHFPPSPPKPLSLSAPWFHLFLVGIVCAVLTTCAEFVYLVGIGREAPMSAAYWASLCLRDIWFVGLAVFHCAWFFAHIARIQARANIRSG